MGWMCVQTPPPAEEQPDDAEGSTDKENDAEED